MSNHFKQGINYAKYMAQNMTLLLQQEDLLRLHFEQSKHLTPTLLELVKLRVSQINQCAYCINMHTKEATAKGEQSERLFGLNAWRDMPMYTQSERLALAWAEQVSAGQSVDEALYQQVLASFGEEDTVHLTLAVNAINSWNRLCKVFKPAFAVS